jgi:magnesium transporter
VVDPSLPPPAMRLIAYSEDRMEERTLTRAEELKEFLREGAWKVVWLDVDGLGDAAALEAVGGAVDLHRLSLADVAHPYQRPKVEDFGKYLFVVVRAPTRSADPAQALDTEQISLCLGARFVLTFQETAKPGDCFDAVRERIRRSSGTIRQRGPDYLAYALLDAAVDAYFPVLEELGERLDALEQAAMARLDPQTMRHLHAVRREFLTVRRAAWPLREAMGSLHRDQTALITDATRPYLRDCYDHTVQIIDLVETGRELGASLMEMHLSMASHRMNEIMKVLTIITTIFIPLSFIAGVYGMNFDVMPELRWRYGYPAVLTVMTVIAGVMVFGFWRRGWIGRGRRG